MDAIFARRSIRKFTDEPLTDAQIERLLRAGMAAACAKGSQNRLFFVSKGQGSLPTLIQVHPNAFALKTATAAITVCADLRVAAQVDPLNTWWVQDCAAALENILVEAAGLGLGGLWIGVHPDPKRVVSVQSDLAAPRYIVPLGVAALGHPAKEKAPTDRFEADKVFYSTYPEEH